ncbi:polyprenyl synthetase family protein [Streptomyces longispororuber]|uniref:polyprenyl synthetase family protein n=1 Tax=Streptomyces longispororuber TaxID=68230 RepID=UPI0036F80C8D
MRADVRRFSAELRTHITALYPDADSLDADAVRDLLGLPDVSCLQPGLLTQLAPRLHEALVRPVRHLVDGGGRRWRPYLMAKVIETLGGDSRRFGPILAAGELMHTGSLIVDDVEDGAGLRRGTRAAHLVYGMPVALNAGTAAYLAFHRALCAVVPDDAALRSAVQDVYLRALRAAHAGQGLDIAGLSTEMDTAVATGDPRALLDHVRLTHRLKSGVPVRAAFEVAALLTGAPARVRGGLGRYGEAIGVAYQITDDVLDLRGVVHEGVPTKAVAEDLRNGKVTMPLAHAVALLPRRRMGELWRRAREGRWTPESLREDVAVLTRCGALQACVEEADRLLDAAWRDLRPDLPRNRAALFVRAVARHTVHRARVA